MVQTMQTRLSIDTEVYTVEPASQPEQQTNPFSLFYFVHWLFSLRVVESFTSFRDSPLPTSTGDEWSEQINMQVLRLFRSKSCWHSTTPCIGKQGTLTQGMW